MQKGLPVRFQRSKTNNRGSVVKIWLQVVTRTEMLGNDRAKKPETRVRFGKVASNPFGHMKFEQKRPTNYWNLRRYRF